jgi:hypothetical protein
LLSIIATFEVGDNLVGTLVACHTEQQGVLKDIDDSENEIKGFNALITVKLQQLQSL